MKKAIFLAMLLVSGIALSQEYQSGDAELDANLEIVNADGSKDLTSFKLNLTKIFNVILPEVEECFKIGMNAGDAFMACQISAILKRPLKDVFLFYNTSRSKGWEAVAKELGVKPGSTEFNELKERVKDMSKASSKTEG